MKRPTAIHRSVLLATTAWCARLASAEPCASGEPTATGNMLGVRLAVDYSGTKPEYVFAPQLLRAHVDCEREVLSMAGIELAVRVPPDAFDVLGGHTAAIAGADLPTLLGHLGVGLDAGIGVHVTGDGVRAFAFLTPRAVAANLSFGSRLGWELGRGRIVELEARALIPFAGATPGKFW